MINRGKKLLRISPKDQKKLEYSTNGVRVWNPRYAGNSGVGEFRDLMDSVVRKSLVLQVKAFSIQLTMVGYGIPDVAIKIG